MNSKILGLSIFVILTSFHANAAEDSPYLSAEEVIKMANTPQRQVQLITQNLSPAVLTAVNLSFNRIAKFEKQELTDKHKKATTPEEIAQKINELSGLDINPIDLIYLMKPELPENQNETPKETQEQTQKEEIQTSTPNLPTQTTGTLKDVIISEDDDSTKHIYRRKVFIKQ